MSSNSHIRSTLKHAMVYGSAGVIGKVIGFIMLPIYAHHLQAEGYGVLGMIDSVLSLLTLLIGYGVTGAMSRFYFETEDQRERDIIISTTIILMFVLVEVVTLPALLLSKVIAYLAFGHSEWWRYSMLAILAFMASMTSKNAENYILIRQKSIFISIVSIIRLVFALSLNIYFIVILEKGVLGYLYSSLISAVVYCVFVHIYALRNVGFRYDSAIARKVINFSLPLLPGYIAMFLRNNADRVILRTYLGLTSVGIFEMLFKFATLIGLFVVDPFAKIWYVKRLEICDSKDGPSVISRVFTYHMAIMLTFALVLSLEIPILLKLLTPKEFWLSGYIVYAAVISRVLNGAYYHLFFGLVYSKKNWRISLIQWTTAIISISITYPLIRLYGLPGSIMASLLSVIVQCSMGFLLSKPYYKIPIQWGALIKMFLITTTLFSIAKDFTIENTGVSSFLNSHIAPLIRQVLVYFSLDQVKNGKLITLLVDSLPVTVDGAFLLIYSMLFVVGLIVLKIIPTSMVGRLFTFNAFRGTMRNLP